MLVLKLNHIGKRGTRAYIHVSTFTDSFWQYDAINVPGRGNGVVDLMYDVIDGGVFVYVGL